MRYTQLIIALVINILLLWAYDASPDEYPYTLEAVHNNTKPDLPTDVASSTAYTVRAKWAEVVVRVLGALLAMLGALFVYLHQTNSTVMILPSKSVNPFVSRRSLHSSGLV